MRCGDGFDCLVIGFSVVCLDFGCFFFSFFFPLYF